MRARAAQLVRLSDALDEARDEISALVAERAAAARTHEVAAAELRGKLQEGETTIGALEGALERTRDELGEKAAALDRLTAELQAQVRPRAVTSASPPTARLAYGGGASRQSP